MHCAVGIHTIGGKLQRAAAQHGVGCVGRAQVRTHQLRRGLLPFTAADRPCHHRARHIPPPGKPNALVRTLPPGGNRFDHATRRCSEGRPIHACGAGRLPRTEDRGCAAVGSVKHRHRVLRHRLPQRDQAAASGRRRAHTHHRRSDLLRGRGPHNCIRAQHDARVVRRSPILIRHCR